MREGGELPAELDDYYTTAARIMRLQFARASREKIAAAIDGYDDDIRLVDSKVDTLVGALRDADILGRSVVVIASDHGEGLWKRPTYGQIAEENPVGADGGDPEGGPDAPKVKTILSTHKMTHGNQLFEELIHVPLIFHAPAFATNVVVAQPVENVDVLPTLLEMAGIPAPPRLGGRSLLPLMRGEEVEPDPTSGVSVTRWFRTIRSADGLKVIAPTTAGLEAGLAVEAYDLIHDPHERTNLFAARSDASVELMLRLDEELAGSLPGEDGISDANLEALRALGYTE
jgi:arylsulfatase A-like enzyme